MQKSSLVCSLFVGEYICGAVAGEAENLGHQEGIDVPGFLKAV